jgi:hypothetical protein
MKEQQVIVVNQGLPEDHPHTQDNIEFWWGMVIVPLILGYMAWKKRG